MKTVFTTSREPSQRTRSFLKDFVTLSPHFVRITRGKYTFREIVELARLEKARFLAVIGEMRGNPSIIRLYDIDPVNDDPSHIYTVFLKGITLSREAGNSKPSKNEGTYILAPYPDDEQDRLVTIFFIDLFKAKPLDGIPPKNSLVIRIRPYWLGEKKVHVIDFYEGSPRKLVGPIIRIWGIKRVGEKS